MVPWIVSLPVAVRRCSWNCPFAGSPSAPCDWPVKAMVLPAPTVVDRGQLPTTGDLVDGWGCLADARSRHGQSEDGTTDHHTLHRNSLAGWMCRLCGVVAAESDRT